jgi:ribosome biogenesis GTPase
LSELTGLITKSQSGFFTVHTPAGDIVCRLRGRLKQRRQQTDLAAVGDRVTITRLPDGTGMIEAVAPRERVLSRRAAGGGGRAGRGARGGADDEAATEQVIVANPDQVMLVFACAEPAPRLRMLYRFLVAAEASHVPARICANKADLVSPEAAGALFGDYARIGYPVFYTSAVTGQGLAVLRAALRGKITVLSGPSGVGKSSLLNALQPGLGLRARAVSQATTKGRHTTVHSELLALDEGGYVADTPGLRSLGLWDIEPEELDGYFVEIKPYVELCVFSDCTHTHEPGCAVRAAVEAGSVAPSRYDSYLRLRSGES